MSVLRPLGDWLAVLPPPIDNGLKQSDGGIYLPSSVNPNAPWDGTVVAVGPGTRTEDQSGHIPMRCKLGDKILFSRFVALETEINGTIYRFVRDRDVIVIIETEPLPGQVVPEDN